MRCDASSERRGLRVFGVSSSDTLRWLIASLQYLASPNPNIIVKKSNILGFVSTVHEQH